MAEELRLFLRTALFVALLALIYWFASYEIAGTLLLAVLGLALAALIAMVATHQPATVRELEGDGRRGRSRALGWLNRAIGFHERAGERPPLEGGPQLVPLRSAWPILSAAGLVLVGLGLIFGPWLSVPGAVLLALAGLGWTTQLDRR